MRATDWATEFGSGEQQRGKGYDAMSAKQSKATDIFLPIVRHPSPKTFVELTSA
jgi:hypothetical protein